MDAELSNEELADWLDGYAREAAVYGARVRPNSKLIDNALLAARRLRESVPRDVTQPFLAACIYTIGEPDRGVVACRLCENVMLPGETEFPHKPDCPFAAYDAATSSPLTQTEKG